MKFTIEMTKKDGLLVSGQVPPSVLRVVISLTAGGLTLPWLMDIGRSLGWI